MMNEEQFWSILQYVEEEAKKLKDESVLDWLQNKKGENLWILKCLNRATTKMNHEDWYSTSFSTNIAESAHALSQRDGTKLSLVSAVQRAKQLDERFLEGEKASRTMGVFSKYGNNSLTGRSTKNLKRSAKKAKKRAGLDPKLQQQEAILERASGLIREGIALNVVEFYLNSEQEKLQGGE